jgi:hypothetical protein
VSTNASGEASLRVRFSHAALRRAAASLFGYRTGKAKVRILRR